MYTIYAIYNQGANRLYIDQTVDLETRLEQHSRRTFRGYASRFDGKWTLIYSEVVGTRQEALVREKQLKSFRGREFVKKFIPA